MKHVDWVEMGRRALELLQDLLRIDTRNPPGNERPAAELIVQRLRASGLEPRMFEGQANRTNVVCRIEGSGEEEPLLLAGHLDVVPVEEERWEVPPFEGRIHNGYLYGRGAIDMKNHVAACVVIMQTLAELGVRPKRDIIFAAVADEEEGCRWGSQYMVEEHPDEVRAGWMIGEVGGFTLYLGDTCYYPIQVAEKGRTILKMTAHGEPGHGSMPHKAMAITRLSEALARLGTSRLPQHRCATVDRFLRVLRQTQTPPNSLILPRLNNPRLSGPILDRVLPPETAKSLAAALSNTVAPTILEAGIKSNVIPSEASCLLDGRTLPGQSASDLIAELRALLGDDLDFEVVQSFPALEQPEPDSALYRHMCSALTKHDPGSVPLPYLTVGFTDAQFFSRLGARCYGFSPMRFPKDDNVRFSELFHGHNERIHVEGFRWGVRVLWDVVRDFVL